MSARRAWRPIDNAAQYLGRTEVIGPDSDPAILAMLTLDNRWPKDDATPWCSAFVAWAAFNTGYERSSSLRARSWLTVGMPVWMDHHGGDPLRDAQVGDVLIFSRGRWRPGSEVIQAPGHVGFYTGRTEDVRNYTATWVLGGNQGNAVSIKPYSTARLLGVRRLRRQAKAGFIPEAA